MPFHESMDANTPEPIMGCQDRSMGPEMVLKADRS